VSADGSLFHAGGAAIEKALSPIRRRVRSTTTSPGDEACSAE